jgi:hypothetical protein
MVSANGLAGTCSCSLRVVLIRLIIENVKRITDNKFIERNESMHSQYWKNILIFRITVPYNRINLQEKSSDPIFANV